MAGGMRGRWGMRGGRVCVAGRMCDRQAMCGRGSMHGRGACMVGGVSSGYCLIDPMLFWELKIA